MPTPKPDESEDDFMERCVPMAMEEGKENGQAVAMCRQMFSEHKQNKMMMSTYLIDKFVSTKPGEPYRLFPFGVVFKGGKQRHITPEYAASFRLPHFKPPIKLGSHKEETPAGGHMLRLEVRQTGNPDTAGLWVVPEMNDNGAKAVFDGAYRYHSPEVIFEGGLEDPKTGKLIPAPLIVGDALLHTPHLGEATALYSIEPILQGEKPMTDSYTVPASFFEKFMGLFDRNKSETPPPPEAPKPTEDYSILQTKVDEYAAKIATLEAQNAQQAQFSAIRGEFQAETFGAAYKALGTDATVEMLSTMTETQRAWTLTQLKALSAQIKEADLTGNLGKHTETGSDPTTAFNAAIVTEMEKNKTDYATAALAVAKAQPEVYTAYMQARGGK